MYIVSQDKTRVINVDNVEEIRIETPRIIAATKNDDIVIGEYSGFRAEEVFKNMLETVFPADCIIMQDIEHTDKIFPDHFGTIEVHTGRNEPKIEYINGGVYYMPEL